MTKGISIYVNVIYSWYQKRWSPYLWIFSDEQYSRYKTGTQGPPGPQGILDSAGPNEINATNLYTVVVNTTTFFTNGSPTVSSMATYGMILL